jgi:cell division protein FtsW
VRRLASLLTVVVMILVSVGIVMLFSTSSVRGTRTFDDPQYFLKRQMVWLLISLVVGLLIVRFDYHWYQKLAPLLYVIAVLLLVAVLIPGLGTEIGGGRRWLRAGPLSFQPSELAKMTIVIALSAWMANVGRHAQRLKEGLVLPILGMGLVLGLLILEPDFGTTLLTGMAGLAVMFAGGARLVYLAGVGLLGILGFAAAVFQDPVRLGRVMAFIDPEKFPRTAHHLRQSTEAFMHGGWHGVGLDNSIKKQLYLPEAHTDFILAIIGEELGFIATIGIVIGFLLILVIGMTIALRAPDAFGRLLAFGVTTMITLQAAINIGVVTGCLPTKGLPLPFISYGGSSILASVAGVCILLNIAEHCRSAHMDSHTRAIKDRSHDL